MFRKWIALFLCLTLCLSSAAAAQTPANTTLSDAESVISTADTLLFPKVNTYSGFSDTGNHWAASSIKVCYETGLMQGQGGGRFAPDVSISNAEIAMITARIHAAIHGTSFQSDAKPWYKGAVDYLTAHGIKTGSPNAYATRQGFFQMLSAVIPDHMLLPINSIIALPDTTDPAVLKFYNAGILTGVDRYGTFDGKGALTRSQCAAMVARIIDPSLRRHFTPAGQVPAAPFADDAVVLTVNGIPVTFDIFSQVMLSLIDETQLLYKNYGLVFNWDGNYGVDDWPELFKSATAHSVAADIILVQKAEEMGCHPEELSFKLFGLPTDAELAAYALENNISMVTPNAEEVLTELILEEKLNTQMGKWVEEATLVTTQVYDQLDPKELWTLLG